MMLARTIFLLLVLTTTISSNAFYGNWKNKLKTLKTKTNDKIIDKIQGKSQCPTTWQYFAASCYWKFPRKHSWSEARNECARFRADLVVIDSDNEFDYIAKNITDLREDFYVGFHYFNDSWSWINGQALSDYTYYTEEDLCEDRLPIEPRHRSCGILDRARRGRLCMNVDVCDRKLNFICEKVVDRCSSLHDTCGKHGRCINTDDGQFRCDCHFLFGGDHCRSISREGGQVLMAAIFAFAACITPMIFRSIFRMLKRKLNRTSTIYGKLHSLNNSEHLLSKHKVKQEKILDSLLKLLFSIQYSNICNSSSFIIIFSTLLLTSFCLLTIPFIQYRFSFSSLFNHTNVTLTYKINSTLHLLHTCHNFDNYTWKNFVSLPSALIVALICSFLRKRDTLCLRFCNGRPALPMPFNIFDKRQRHVIAAIFGISANEVLKILEELLIRFNSKQGTNDQGIIIELLRHIGVVLLIGLRYFPLLISVNTAHPISYALGLIYTFIDGTYTLIHTSYCSRFSLFRFDRTLILQSSATNEIIQSDTIYVMLRNLPHFTLVSFVFVKFFYLLIQQLKCRCCQQSAMMTNHNHNEKVHQVSLVSSVLSLDLLLPDYQTKPEFYYTQGLLKSKESSDMYYNNVLTRPFAKIYRWHRYFTFSIQILCTYTVVLVVIYNLTCLLTFYGIHTIKNQLDRIHFILLSQLNWNIEWGTSFINDIYLCSILSVIIYCTQIFNGLVKIQQHLISAYAGKYIDIPPRHNFSNNELISKCLHFSGYLCGYTAWGFIIFYKVSFVFCLLLRLWIRYDPRWFQHILALCLPIVLVYLLKHILVSLLSEFVFLQNFGRTPSLNNRRIYFIFNYFNFFFDCFLGILSCYIRVSKSLLASLLFMGRLDYSFMGRNLERLDQGYATYVTFIHMEIIHGHPILVTFCDMFWHDIERKRHIIHQHSKNNKLIYDSITQTKVHAARFKWHLFYTLIRNEYLKFLRKHALLVVANSTGMVSSTTAVAVVLTRTPSNEKSIHNEQNSSILLYDRPIMRQPPIPAKRSGYRYNFDYEQTSDLRFIYQQLKSLTTNVSQLKNNNHNLQQDELSKQEHHHHEQTYLPPNQCIIKKQSQVTCTFPDDYASSKFHHMPTIQRR
ncbi:unnamed protein product [Rotaria magnacalcarata]|uniref:EGF-like domain-containing protein n=4 Tax=Rotaria magnacalcarata TaxID=392030 RepID=A0A819CQG9_9BILA|nr:unnamed protein product [Rotaria magnacalcarata]CAF2097925.1 unnamed protein product [Rotaria magnacalcarata]CAF3822978.1 unnamed protein product [Rotaria magnacalcarata]